MSGQERGQTPELQREWVDMANRLGEVMAGPLVGRQVTVAPEFVQAAQVLMFHFGRSFRTFQAIGLLLSGGYRQDAIVLARTLLEILFEMVFLLVTPRTLIIFLSMVF